MFSFVLVCSCSNDGNDAYVCGEVKPVKEFNTVVKLDKSVPLNIELTGVNAVFNIDSIMIGETSDKEYLWNVYSINDGRQLGRLLRKGHGNNEFYDAPTSATPLVTDSALYCDILDSYTSTWRRVDIGRSIKERTVAIADKRNFSTKDHFSNVFNIGSGCFLMVQNKDYRSFVRYINNNGKDKLLDNVGNINDLEADEDINIISAVRCFSVQRGMAAEALIRLDQINVYSLKHGGKSFTISLNDNLQSVSRQESMPRKLLKKCFCDIKAYDDYFAALYSGASVASYFTGKADRSFVMIFSWDGDALMKIEVPVSASSFFIYKDFLYVFSNTDKECLYKYKMPKL